MRSEYCIIGELVDNPAEGMQVVTKAILRGLAARGSDVDVISPQEIIRAPWRLLGTATAKNIVFTHGPGPRVVATSVVLRRFTAAKLIWIATRPDLSGIPACLLGRPTAHTVIGNTRTDDLAAAAPNANFIQQFIGISRRRTSVSSEAAEPIWAGRTKPGRPVALHVGHLQPNRGLAMLAEAKRHLGTSIEVVVLGSPTFRANDATLRELKESGVHVFQEYVPDIHACYAAADIYLFCATQSQAGAIELPLSVLEAIAAGTPVLSTRFGSLPDALEGRTAIWFSTPDQYAKTLAEIVAAQSYRIMADLPYDLELERLLEVLIAVTRDNSKMRN